MSEQEPQPTMQNLEDRIDAYGMEIWILKRSIDQRLDRIEKLLNRLETLSKLRVVKNG